MGAEEPSTGVTSVQEWTAKPGERVLKRKKSPDRAKDKACQINFPINLARLPRNLFPSSQSPLFPKTSKILMLSYMTCLQIG